MARVPAAVVLALALAAPARGEENCPPLPERSAERAAILAELAAAPSESAARAPSDKLWRLLTAAPDAKAQEMLDRGMRARASYDFDAAIAALDELIAYCPHYAEGWNQRAFVRFLRGDYAGALEDLDRALELDPLHVPAMAGRALSLLYLGRVEAGQAQLRAALKLNPWLPERGYLIPVPGEEL